MTPAEIEAFLEPPRVAVLATINRDGSPALNPVWYVYEHGRFCMIVNDSSYYAKNINRDPRITVCVQQEEPPYKAVVAHGPVTAEPDTGGAMVRRLAIRYFGEAAGNAYADKNTDPGDRLITLTPARLASWDYSKR